MTARWNTADLARSQKPKQARKDPPRLNANTTPLSPQATDPTKGVSAGNKRSNEKRLHGQADALLRPACAVSTWSGCNGMRFVAHGLDVSQARSLIQAAQALGIAIQS